MEIIDRVDEFLFANQLDWPLKDAIWVDAVALVPQEEDLIAQWFLKCFYRKEYSCAQRVR